MNDINNRSGEQQQVSQFSDTKEKLQTVGFLLEKDGNRGKLGKKLGILPCQDDTYITPTVIQTFHLLSTKWLVRGL